MTTQGAGNGCSAWLRRMAGSPHRWRDGLCLAVGAGPLSTRSNGFAGRSASRRYHLWTGFPSIIPAVNRDHGARLQADGPAASIGILNPSILKPQSSSILPHGHGPQLARRARRSDAPTLPSPSKSAGQPLHGPQLASSESRSPTPTLPLSSISQGQVGLPAASKR